MTAPKRRPRGRPRDPRTERITVRLSPDELEAITRAAGHYDRAAWIRAVVLERLDSITPRSP